MGLQLLIWAVVAAATLDSFAERSLILGQAVGSLAVLPWQIDTLRRALNLELAIASSERSGTQAIILIIGSILLWFLAGYIRVDSLIKLALVAGTFCLTSWVAQYFLVLEARHRAVFPSNRPPDGPGAKKQLTER